MVRQEGRDFKHGGGSWAARVLGGLKGVLSPQGMRPPCLRPMLNALPADQKFDSPKFGVIYLIS